MAPLMNLLQTVSERSKTKRGKNSRKKKEINGKNAHSQPGYFQVKENRFRFIFLETRHGIFLGMIINRGSQ